MGESEATKRFLEAVSLKRVIDEAGLDKLWANLTPEQRAELKQRLQ
jgi:hypothetical protein